MVCLEVKPAGLLGNQIFQFASGTSIAAMLNASLCMTASAYKHPNLARNMLPHVFGGPFPVCSCFSGRDKRTTVVQELQEASSIGYTALRFNAGTEVAVLHYPSYLQSFRYFDAPATAAAVRQPLRWTHAVLEIARSYVANLTRGATDSIILVGVHVRHRGRVGSSKQHTAPSSYLESTLARMRQRHGPHVRFLVASDDVQWCRAQACFRREDVHIAAGAAGPGNVLDPTNAAVGMAMLGLCDHLILTIGTYGWLGAWLGPQALGRPGDRASRDRREILYFDGEFTSRYRASMQFVHEDYYPASWTAMRPAAIKRRPTTASMAVQQPIEERWVPVAYVGNCSTLRAHSRRHGGYHLQTSCHADVTQSAAAT